MVLDGYTGFGHSLPLANVYGDAVGFSPNRRPGTPRCSSSPMEAPRPSWYFYQNTEVHDDEKLRRFTPHAIIDRRTRRGRYYADD